MIQHLSRLLGLVVITTFVATSGRAAFVINVNYTGDPSYQSYFTSAANTWQSLITGYQNGVVANRTGGSSYQIGQTVSTVTISAVIHPIDGVGQVLGGAGPTQYVLDNSGYFLATDGDMEFDVADIPNLISTNRMEAVILHEMAHALGFGTLWNLNNVYIDGTGEFTGANATAVWQSEFGQPGTPNVELEGGAGTANGHWNENQFGTGLVGIVDGAGRDMQSELMTGWLNVNPYISNLTLASFRDIGFTTVITAVPEPASLALLSLTAIPALALARRRKSTSPPCMNR